MLDNLKIIYEDASILVINKPSGLVVNRAETVKEKVTLMDWLEERLDIRDFSTEFGMRRGLVHRLDKETSGAMVVAKTESSFINLQKQFKERSVQKEYVALVHNGLGKKLEEVITTLIPAFGGKAGIYKSIKNLDSGFRQNDSADSPELRSVFAVDAPLGRNPKNRFKWAIVEGGREARTEFKILEKLEITNQKSENACDVIPAKAGIHYIIRLTESKKNWIPAYAGMTTFLLLRCFPKTGRTHQIRVHLAAMNCPVVSDPLYLNKRGYNKDKQWCTRMFLHAQKLGFYHPDSGEWVEFSSELPKDLCSILPLNFA